MAGRWPQGRGSALALLTLMLTIIEADAQSTVWDLGSAHSCVANDHGLLHCWGLNAKGQLGDGTAADKSTPVPLPNLGKVVSVACGDSHTCAVNSSGSVFCWGDNGYGQVGDGTFEARTTPVLLQNLQATSVSAGRGHTCALDSSAELFCWGANGYGQLGVGWSNLGWPTPLRVTKRGPWAAVVTSPRDTTCALPKGTYARFYCWGDNSMGQLGDSTATNAEVPEISPFAINSQVLALGGLHSCSAYKQSSVYCWGANNRGQSGTAQGASPMVAAFGDAMNVLAAGLETTCVTNAAKEVECWGAGDKGQFADGKTQDSPSPRRIEGVKDVHALATSGAHACAVDAAGSLFCWGANEHGQLGQGSTGGVGLPVAVKGFKAAATPIPASPPAPTCAEAEAALTSICNDRFPTLKTTCVKGGWPLVQTKKDESPYDCKADDGSSSYVQQCTADRTNWVLSCDGGSHNGTTTASPSSTKHQLPGMVIACIIVAVVIGLPAAVAGIYYFMCPAPAAEERDVEATELRADRA